jgi:surface antigen
MKKWTNYLVAATMGIALVGCSDISNQGVGAVTGGVLGGALGSTIGGGSGRTVAIIGGTILGSLLGSQVGKSMDQADQMRFNQALETAPTNKAYQWQNPDTGNAYIIVPTNTVVVRGQPCREFTTTANIGGKSERIYGKACRDASGQWKVVN